MDRVQLIARAAWPVAVRAALVALAVVERLLMLACLMLIVYGVAMIYLPAAVILGGVMGLVLLVDVPGRKDRG